MSESAPEPALAAAAGREAPPRFMRSELARGAAWNLAGNAIARGLALLAFAVVARRFGQAGLGEIGIVLSTVAMIQGVAGGALGLLGSRYVAQLRESDPARAAAVLAFALRAAALVGALAAAILFGCAPWLARSVFDAPQLEPALRIGAVVLFLGTVAAVQTGVLAGLQAFRSIAAIALASGAATLAGYLLASKYFDLHGVLCASAAGAALGGWLGWRAVGRHAAAAGLPRGAAASGGDWRLMARYALPAALSAASVAPVIWAGNALLIGAKGSAEMGVFVAASQWYQIVLFVPSGLGAVAVPLLAAREARGDAGGFERLFRNNLLLNIGVAAAVAAVVTALAPFVMLLYGESFGARHWVLVLLCGAAVLNAAAAAVGNTLASRGLMWAGFGLNLIWAACLLGSAWQLSGYGAEGLAAAYLAAYALHALVVWLYVRRVLRPARMVQT